MPLGGYLYAVWFAGAAFQPKYKLPSSAIADWVRFHTLFRTNSRD